MPIKYSVTWKIKIQEMKTAMMKNPRVFISKDIRETIAIMKQEQETMKMEQRIK